jgi:hypothetical protein
MNDDDSEASEREGRARLRELTQDHSDLDIAVQAMANQAVPDMMAISRLKRKKLLLKDEIERLKDQLTPDIIA